MGGWGVAGFYSYWLEPEGLVLFCPLAVMLIDCFTLTVCCVLDLLDLLDLLMY